MPKPNAAACIVCGCLGILSPHVSRASGIGPGVLEGSVRLPEADGLTIGSARIIRSALTPAELSATMSFSVTLRMRDFAGLQARVASGQLVPRSEMEARYLPLLADYDRVAAWLASQGFTPTLADNSHISVFVRGSVAQVARAFGVAFARVAASDGEYTSAVSAPGIPADLAGVVLAVNGLQPEFRLRHVKAAGMQPQDLVGQDVFVTPDNLSSAYSIPKTATGAGQIIAIVDQVPVANSDLTTFWSTVGVSQTAANVTTINVDGGPPSNPTDAEMQESDLDVQWAGAMAPGAAIRLYLSANVFETFTQILNDIPNYPTMTVLSMSYETLEAGAPAGSLQSFSQVTADCAASGMTILASSGDSGSNPNGTDAAGNYSATAPLSVGYPGSDPSVTGVGGTTVEYTGNWAYAGEVAWDQLSADQSATGGGVSTIFPKPAWQNGGSLLAGQSMRCVPDVAAIADADLTNVNIGAKYLPFTGSAAGAVVYVSGQAVSLLGTSLSCPVWAAIAAQVNQARAAAGHGPIGLLNPYLYPLSGSGVFNDVTGGTNGAYNAGPGYNLCTGLGTPNVANLIAALSGSNGPSVAQRLVNISTRADVETGGNILIAGFVISGPAGTFKNVLVRGVGPTLAEAPYNVAGTLSQPVVSVFDSSSTLIASDAGWGVAPSAGTSTAGATFWEATAQDMSSVGAFALASGSLDSAMVLSLPPGSYTVEVSGSGSGTGVALAEVYELNTSAPELLVNISARCFIGTGSAVAISGFVVEGTLPANLLIRGVGPGLATYNVPGTLAEPSIALTDSAGTLIVSNTGWGNSPVAGTSLVAATYRQATAADMASAGAFALAAGSADSAIVVTLPPGSYTAVITGVGNTTGTALVEVYELP